MPTAYDPSAPKEPVTLNINADLLAIAVELGVNLSSTLEQALVEATTQREPRGVENRKAEAAGSVGETDPVLLAAAIGLFGNEPQALSWLNTPAPALGHRCPVDADTQEVLELIGRIAHGFCA